MRKIQAAAALLAVLFLLTGCVPTAPDQVSVAPDLSVKENVQLDFTQLHNDTLNEFGNYPQYSFITDVDITGNNEKKMIYVKAYGYSDVEQRSMDAFLAALLRRINDAAFIQDATVEISSSEGFGSLWDRFGCEIRIYNAETGEVESAAEGESAAAEELLCSLDVKAGEPVDLDPDVESFEAEWEKELEILVRNLE